jgi:TRAP-type C4-dicarboxylate transport system permease small subunit
MDRKTLRIISKVGLLLVIMGFSMPVSCNLNGFQLADMISDNGLKFALYALFVFACLGGLLLFMLMSSKNISLGVDCLATLGAVICGGVAFSQKPDKNIELQSGAYVIIAGLAVSLIFLFMAAAIEDAPENTSGEKSSFPRSLEKLEWLGETIVAVIFAVMVLTVFIGVVMRYVVGIPSIFLYELPRILFIWMVFIGIVLALAKNRHVAFDAIQEAVPPPVRKILRILTLLGICIVSFILMVYGYSYSEQNFAWPSPGLLIPFGYISLVLPISGAGMLLVGLCKLAAFVLPKKGGS